MVASDSQATGDFKWFGGAKFKRVTVGPWAGYIVAGCGDVPDIEAAYKQVDAGELSAVAASSAQILIIGRKVWLMDVCSAVPFEVPKTFAIGSGALVAMGAMYAGATAVEAVRIACRLDDGTGGKVHSMKIIP